MQGILLQVSISPGGLPKRAVASAAVTELGIVGDAHSHPHIHGGPLKAILLAGKEVLDRLASRGYPLFPGALGENLTTSGIDVRALRLGHRLRVGEVELELTSHRVPCSQLDVYGSSLKSEIYDKRVKAGDAESPFWGMAGLYAKVIKPGTVQPGDIIALAP